MAALLVERLTPSPMNDAIYELGFNSYIVKALELTEFRIHNASQNAVYDAALTQNAYSESVQLQKVSIMST